MLSKSQKQLSYIASDLSSAKVSAKEFASLRDSWSTKESIKRADKIISNTKRSRRGLNITTKPKRDSKLIIAKSNITDKTGDLDYLLNKILNANIIINKIAISKDSISFEVAK